MAGIAGLRNGSESSVTEPQISPEQAALSELYDEVCLQCDPLIRRSADGLSDLERRTKEVFKKLNPDGDADRYWKNMVKMATHLPKVDTMSFWRNGR